MLSASEKIAIFGFPDLLDVGPLVAAGVGAWGSTGDGAAEAKGSIFAAKAGRTLGNAGEDGPSEGRG